MDIRQLLTAGQQDTDNEYVRDWATRKIAEARARIIILEKLVAEVDAIGADRINRISQLAIGVDPDAPKPVLKVGPHGPGCECDPDDAEPDLACVKH